MSHTPPIPNPAQALTALQQSGLKLFVHPDSALLLVTAGRLDAEADLALRRDPGSPSWQPARVIPDPASGFPTHAHDASRAPAVLRSAPSTKLGWRQDTDIARTFKAVLGAAGVDKGLEQAADELGQSLGRLLTAQIRIARHIERTDRFVVDGRVIVRPGRAPAPHGVWI